MSKQKKNKRRNKHHLFWEGRMYTTGTEHAFRELPCLKVQMDIEVHDLLHQMYRAPRKLTQEIMEYFIMRHNNHRCACEVKVQTQSVNILAIGGEEDGRIEGGVAASTQDVWSD